MSETKHNEIKRLVNEIERITDFCKIEVKYSDIDETTNAKLWSLLAGPSGNKAPISVNNMIGKKPYDQALERAAILANLLRDFFKDDIEHRRARIQTLTSEL